MPKRFTATEKWHDNWFMGLEPKYKALWGYVCDNCDHAGIWEGNWKLASFQTGFEYDPAEALKAMDGRVIPIGGKFFLPGFVPFQYGNLNPGSRVHLSVINRLKSVGLFGKGLHRVSKGLAKGYLTLKDKDMDKDKDKDMDKKEGGAGEGKKPLPADFGRVVGHIRTSYAKSGRKFGDKEGRQTKNLLANYPGPQVMAMWDVFMAKNWNWEDSNRKMVVVPHDLETFWKKITFILEGTAWKDIMKKYEVVADPENVQKLTETLNGNKLTTIPRVDHRGAKQTALNQADTLLKSEAK